MWDPLHISIAFYAFFCKLNLRYTLRCTVYPAMETENELCGTHTIRRKYDIFKKDPRRGSLAPSHIAVLVY